MKIVWADEDGNEVASRSYKSNDEANVAYDKACAEADHGKGFGSVVLLEDGDNVKRHRGIFIDDRIAVAEAAFSVETEEANAQAKVDADAKAAEKAAAKQAKADEDAKEAADVKAKAKAKADEVKAPKAPESHTFGGAVTTHSFSNPFSNKDDET